MTTQTKRAPLTAREVAERLGTDPRSARRFLRRCFPELHGEAGNWEIERKIMPQLKRAWEKFHQRGPVTIPHELVHKRATHPLV